MPVNSFVTVAFDDNWYLGQLELCSPEEADINYVKRVGQSYFQWPSPPDLKKTKAIYVLQGNIAIAPRDSGLRMWKVCSTSSNALTKNTNGIKKNSYNVKYSMHVTYLVPMCPVSIK